MFPGITLSLRRRWRKPIRLPSSRPPCGGSRVCVSLSGKLFEIALGDAGNRACPVIGTLFERRSGGWKSCRRRIPIIYRRNHPSPLLQSGSGAVFVAERAVSVTPYRKTISPQTTQLLFLSLSLSKIGIIDGFLSDKSIREIGKFIKYNIISDFHSDFHRGGFCNGRILNRVRRYFRVPGRRDFKWQTSRQTAFPPRNSESCFSNSSPVLSPWHTAMSAIGKPLKIWCRTVS